MANPEGSDSSLHLPDVPKHIPTTSPDPAIDSGSNEEEEEMLRPNIIKLSAIQTIASLYKASPSPLKPASKPRYSPSASFLERVSLWQGDITKLEVDSIVNAANKSLLGGGGVDGAIHRAAGRELFEECLTLNGAETGEAKITKGYNLPSKHVIHTVGPVYSSFLDASSEEKDAKIKEKAEQLTSCYRNSLKRASENKLKSIAFPSISTGIYGYPIVDATHIALDVVRTFLEAESKEEDSESQFERVIFVVWSDKDKEVYETLIPEYFPDSSET